MKKMKKIVMAALLVGVIFSACRKDEKVLTVAAAASLTDAMKEIAAEFGKEHPDTEIQLSFAATGKLRTQIEKGAPVDVFASASESFGGAKDVSGIVDTATIKVMCYNCLVLAVNKKFPGKDVNSDPVKLIMSAKIKKLAVGTPEYVPAGKYAKLEMEDLKIWKKVSGKLIFANNVRQALAWLEAGEVDAAFIYRTDAFISKKVRIVAEFPTVKGKKIIYPVAVTLRGKSNPMSTAFEAFILSDKGQGILAKTVLSKLKTGGGAELMTEPGTLLVPVLVSLKTALFATLFAVCIGLVLVFFTMGKRNFWTLLVDFLVCIPLFLPPTVLGFYMLAFLGREGFLGSVFGRLFNVSFIFTPAAAVAAAAAAALPIVYKSVKCFLEYVDPEVVNAAKTDGAGSFQVMCFIQIPLARRGILIAGMLAFLRAMGEFGISSMIAGNIPGRTQTMPLAIWDAVMSGKMADAHLLSAALAVFSLFVILAVRYLDNDKSKIIS